MLRVIGLVAALTALMVGIGANLPLFLVHRGTGSGGGTRLIGRKHPPNREPANRGRRSHGHPGSTAYLGMRAKPSVARRLNPRSPPSPVRPSQYSLFTTWIRAWM